MSKANLIVITMLSKLINMRMKMVKKGVIRKN